MVQIVSNTQSWDVFGYISNHLHIPLETRGVAVSRVITHLILLISLKKLLLVMG